ncbi:MAG TPA: rubredoxin [Rhodocyclaceae bacterium]|jgi:rubredoxin
MSSFERIGTEAAGENPGVEASFECGICWHVYDPAEGDDVCQIPPGTPFAALPANWTCPNCDAPKHKFMVLPNA